MYFGYVLSCICTSRCVFCRELRSPRPFLGQILCVRLLRSLVVWSRSTLGRSKRLSLFHGLRTQHCADRAWPRLFHGLSLDRHPPVSGFVLVHNRMVIVALHRTMDYGNLLSCHVPVLLPFLFFHRHPYVCDNTHINIFYCHYVIYGQISLPITKTFRHTSGQVLNVLMKSCVFHVFFFNIITSLTHVYQTFLVVLQHGTTVRLRGGRAAYP